MPHPRAVINPLWAKRLKELCEENKLSQAELAERIPISQQTISKIINGKATLTLQTAQRIIDLYPSYRIEWLTGIDDYKTLDNLIDKRVNSQSEAVSLIESLMKLHGYTIRTDEIDPDTSAMTKSELAEYKRKPYRVMRYSLWDSTGNGRYFQNRTELDTLLSDISKYVFFKCWECTQDTERDWMFIKFEGSE